VDVYNESIKEKNNNLTGKCFTVFNDNIKDEKNTKDKDNYPIWFCLALFPCDGDLSEDIFVSIWKKKKMK